MLTVNETTFGDYSIMPVITASSVSDNSTTEFTEFSMENSHAFADHFPASVLEKLAESFDRSVPRYSSRLMKSMNEMMTSFCAQVEQVLQRQDCYARNTTESFRGLENRITT